MSCSQEISNGKSNDGPHSDTPITFSCHGDRRIEYFNGDEKINVVTEPVSHSITFWRSKELNENVGRSEWNNSKVYKFVIDNDIEELTKYDNLEESHVNRLKKKDDFFVSEKYGVFEIRNFKIVDSKFVKDEFNFDRLLKFNFITNNLDINTNDLDESFKNKIGRSTYDRTKCEKVTDPNILKEMSVISS
jgi:hypothetical protein